MLIEMFVDSSVVLNEPRKCAEKVKALSSLCVKITVLFMYIWSFRKSVNLTRKVFVMQNIPEHDVD